MITIKPYLIQSGKLSKQAAKGIDGLIRFSYMGAAEFEFGALGESLQRIRSRSSDYKDLLLHLNGKRLWVYIKQELIEQFPDFLELLALGEYDSMLKERCSFRKFITNEKCDENFWWDIENDFMIWEATPEYNSEIVKSVRGY